jgi:hypothetical protein
MTKQASPAAMMVVTNDDPAAEIAQLITQRELNARERLAKLIYDARYDCEAFGAELDWEAKAWDVTACCPRPASKSHGRSILYFTTHENGTSKGSNNRIALPEPFGSVIKALVRKKQEAKASTMDPHARFISAARDLAAQLGDRGYDPCLLTTGDFDAAMTAIRKRTSGDTTNREGNALQELGRQLDTAGVTIARLDWKNPVRKQLKHSRTSPEANAARDRNLPAEEVLDALAAIWHVVEEPCDIVAMGAVTLMHCAPWRIVEVLSIPEDCEVEEQATNSRGELAVDRDGLPIMRYGIRYWKEKLDDPDVKWIPTVMQDVARQAIARIREQTEGARVVARWLHANPGRAFLPGPDQGPGQLFTTAEVARMFGHSSYTSSNLWLINRHVPRATCPSVVGGRPRTVVRRDALERAMLAEIPVVPDKVREVPLHQRMFITFGNFNHRKRETNPCLVEIVSDQHVRDFLGARGDAEKGRVRSAFERLLDRDDLSARTHQFRHWLSTLATAGGLEHGLMARWSGHDEAQNADYDHISGIELAKMAQEMLASGQVMGALADQHEALPPVERSAFREAVISTAHVTEIGFCLADWITSPCPEFGSCRTCEDCAIQKGDKEALARTEAEREEAAWILERLEAEVDDGTIGASNHYDTAKANLDALDRIIAIHNDPAIPDGTLVQPNATSPDHHAGPAFEFAA